MSSAVVHDGAVRATEASLETLRAAFPDIPLRHHPGGVPGIFVPAERLVEVCEYLRDQPGLKFSYLSSITAIDYLDRFEVVYELRSLERHVDTSVRVAIDRENPVVPSVIGLWKTADFQEREVYDLMGVRFEGHPDLRRILLYPEFDGHPLQKDWHLPARPMGVDWTPPAEPHAEVRIETTDNDTRIHQHHGAETERLVVNLGPQHPSTHGVFRLVVALDGETIVDADPVMGYLHRGVEKQAEEGTYLQMITATDRLDYLSSMYNNWALAVAVEQLAGIEVPERAQYIRVIVGELQRIASHSVAFGSFTSDIGTYFTPFLYALREREKILDLLNELSGARMTYSYIRPGGVAADLTEGWVGRAAAFLDAFPRQIDEFESLVSGNEIFLARTKGIAVVSPKMAISYGWSGPCLRGSGVDFDLRRDRPYGIYDRFDFDVITEKNGDCFDRYLVRIKEMRESVKIAKQALDALPGGSVQTPVPRNLRPPVGEAASHVEAPRGELGFYLVSDGSIAPYRAKIRAGAFVNLGPLRELLLGWKVADAIAILGSIDILLGEVDR